MSALSRHLYTLKTFVRAALDWTVDGPKRRQNQRAALSLAAERFPQKKILVATVSAVGPCVRNLEADYQRVLTLGLSVKDDVVLIRPSDARCANPALFDYLDPDLPIVVDDEAHQSICDGGYLALLKSGQGLTRMVPNTEVFKPSGPSVFRVDKRHNGRGHALLSDIGLDPDRPFVTVFNKDDTYYATLKGIEKSWDRPRHSSFDCLIPALRHLVDRGYQVLRVGHYEDDDWGPGIFAWSALSEEDRQFLDLFVHARAEFCISGNSGPLDYPWVLRKPMLYHNCLPLAENHQCETGLYVPKLLRRQGRQLSLSALQALHLRTFVYEDGRFQVVDTTGDGFRYQKEMDLFQLTPIENAAEQLLAGVQDMLAYLPHLEPQDDAMDAETRFLRHFPEAHVLRQIGGHVAPSFLRANRAFYAQPGR